MEPSFSTVDIFSLRLLRGLNDSLFAYVFSGIVLSSYSHAWLDLAVKTDPNLEFLSVAMLKHLIKLLINILHMRVIYFRLCNSVQNVVFYRLNPIYCLTLPL